MTDLVDLLAASGRPMDRLAEQTIDKINELTRWKWKPLTLIKGAVLPLHASMKPRGGSGSAEPVMSREGWRVVKVGQGKINPIDLSFPASQQVWELRQETLKQISGEFFQNKADCWRSSSSSSSSLWEWSRAAWRDRPGPEQPRLPHSFQGKFSVGMWNVEPER